MFRVFQEEKLITICMFAFLGSSILLRVFLGLLYRNMIKEADNMASTRNRLLKQCKTKFASCYQLGNGVANIPVFVDKFLNRMTLGRLSFETIYHLSGQLMLLSVVFSGIGVCKSIIGGRTVGEVLPFYIVSFFGLYLFFSVSTVVDVRGKKRMLKINLVDYLENHLSPRIEVTRQDMEMLYGEAAFEEKQMPYGRIQGGRKEKGRSRRNKKNAQAKPEKRRTVELMPIESRMAAGGDMYQEVARAEQVYPAARQEMWAGGRSPGRRRHRGRRSPGQMAPDSRKVCRGRKGSRKRRSCGIRRMSRGRHRPKRRNAGQNRCPRRETAGKKAGCRQKIRSVQNRRTEHRKDCGKSRSSIHRKRHGQSRGSRRFGRFPDRRLHRLYRQMTSRRRIPRQ